MEVLGINNFVPVNYLEGNSPLPIPCWNMLFSPNLVLSDRSKHISTHLFYLLSCEIKI